MSRERARLQQQARLRQSIRAFFEQRGYLEVDTPVLSSATITDPHIIPIPASVNGSTQYMQTSPEFAMKRLLVEGSGSIYQICHAFRNEEVGRQHRPEFMLLEWYSLGFDYQQLMDQMIELLDELSPSHIESQRIAYRRCFERYLEIDPLTANQSELEDLIVQSVGDLVASQMTRTDCLDLLLSEVIAPQFEGFTLVYDYPAEQASLARLKADDPRLCERFELFYGPMELANGFSELTDAVEQRKRFIEDNQQREACGLPANPIDEAFLSALEKGLPECAGVALGLDRLQMALSGYGDIADVNPLQSD